MNLPNLENAPDSDDDDSTISTEPDTEDEDFEMWENENNIGTNTKSRNYESCHYSAVESDYAEPKITEKC